MLTKIYEIFLWFLGFKEGETITAMLRRQKQRLGGYWWIMVGGTFAGLAALLIHVIGVF